jgi:hypothetical protein
MLEKLRSFHSEGPFEENVQSFWKRYMRTANSTASPSPNNKLQRTRGGSFGEQ